jgi:cytochrome c oxidase subunit IV
MTLQEAATAGAAAAHEETVSGVGHAHPTDGKYVQIALILGVITAGEVSIPYIHEVEGPFLALMLILMAIKFFMVVAWFMHLRFDSKLFRRLFVGGLVLAIGVYVAALSTFQYWGDDTTTVDERTGDGPATAEQAE